MTTLASPTHLRTRLPPTVSPEEIAAEIPPFPVRPLTVEQYEYLVETGFFGAAKVELLDGWVVDKMTHGSLAATVITVLSRLLSRSLSDEVCVRIQLPIQLQRSAPEPDLAIVQGEIERYRAQNPSASDTYVVIEVSDSTLATDRGHKLRIYARAAIREYWIVNCVDRQVDVYTEPRMIDGPARYEQRTTYHVGESAWLNIEGQPRIEVAVAALFGQAQ